MADGERNWMEDIKNRVNGLNPATEAVLWGKQPIYRVPWFLKDLNRKAFKPHLVSFGPYHHDDPRLRPMEKHKQRALLHFLKRAKKPLDDFVSGMKEIVPQLQYSYQDLDEKWRRDRDRFLQLMIVDGCFMLEVMRDNYYSSNDPIFSEHGMLYNQPHIRRDMLMVENQLPLLVLSKLVAVESDIENDDQINNLVLRFVVHNETIPMAGVGLGLHPLDLYRKSLIQSVTPSQERSQPPNLGGADMGSHKARGGHGIIAPGLKDEQKIHINYNSSSVRSLCSSVSAPSRSPPPGIIRSALELTGIWTQDGNRDSDYPGARFIRSVLELVGIWKPAADSPSPGIIRSARELYESGIQFKKSENGSLLDITFHGNVLSLPVIVVDDSTEFEFLNIMAFERLHVKAGDEVSSYVFFMDDIIDSAQDVSLLRSMGIIQNNVGSDKAVANIFNSLSKEAVQVDLSSSKLDEVTRQMDGYCQKKRHRWLANLKRTHFRSPWSLLSLVAAIILLVLTVFQTVYTILSYYNS